MLRMCGYIEKILWGKFVGNLVANKALIYWSSSFGRRRVDRVKEVDWG